MKHTTLLGIAALAALFVAAPAAAQTRVFVSGHGDDSNPCSLSAPCRSFQHAHDTVAAGGEVVALDAAGYGPVTISKAVTITAIGIEASITSNGAAPNAIVINAGASDVVTIRGLSLFSGTNTGDGIAVESAKSVTIRDCSITGFPLDGVGIGPNATLDAELVGVSVTNSGNHGLDIAPTGAGAVTVLVTASSFAGNGLNGVTISGLGSTGTIKATLSLISSGNSNSAIVVTTASGKAQPVVMITESKLVNNAGVGVFANSNVTVFVDRTQISGNGSFGWVAQNSAVVKSFTNNEVGGNSNDNLNGVTQITAQ